MLRKAIDFNGDPGIAVMLTGDGKGFMDGVGYHAHLERMHRKGWKIEVLAWEHTCNVRMKEWAQKVGLFIPLDRYYESITFVEDRIGMVRPPQVLNLKSRPLSKP